MIACTDIHRGSGSGFEKSVADEDFAITGEVAGDVIRRFTCEMDDTNSLLCDPESSAVNCFNRNQLTAANYLKFTKNAIHDEEILNKTMFEKYGVCSQLPV